MIGFPPAAKIKNNKSPFELLDQDEEKPIEQDKNSNNNSSNNKRPVDHQLTKPHSKKKKVAEDNHDNEDFYAVCDEFSHLPALEYAYLVATLLMMMGQIY